MIVGVLLVLAFLALIVGMVAAGACGTGAELGAGVVAVIAGAAALLMAFGAGRLM